MAAKVLIVAVPTVLGIASIRVYTVREVPADELVPRQQLNIYTPLPQSAQAQFVPEVPGVIQSGLTTARESILPFVLAVKGACSSVKKGTVNLYHSAEDAFYYLKDPPPEFLPRFSTITMAGLLGMFLARKGSRFKRVAVPVGLMSAGASVCYPAQTVAVLKVTGKKLYAAGHWSSAAVSALLTPKPKEHITKETAASQAQAAAVPNAESAVIEEATTADGSTQSSVIPEVEVESADQQEPAGAVISEEESLVTLTEIPHEQTPTDTSTDPVVHSVPAETNKTSTSDEIPAPVEGAEPSDIKQAAEDVSPNGSPAEITPGLEPEAVEATPAEAAVVEPAPVEATPMEDVPVEAAPVEDAPVEAAPVEDAPVEAAPVEDAPVEAAPVEDAPVEAAPVEDAPVEAAPVEDAPVEAAPVEDAPVEAAPATPTHCAEVESAPLSEEPSSEVSYDPSVPVAAAVEETPTPTLTPPTPQLPAGENSKGGSGFTPDPALMDFGQSNPEDEDLYSTRS